MHNAITTLSMAQKILLVPFLIFLFASFVSLTRNEQPDNYIVYDNWIRATPNEQVCWINGALLSLEYVSKTYIKATGDTRIIRFIPVGIDSRDIQKLVNRVYNVEQYRSVPVIDIVMRWEYWTKITENQPKGKETNNDTSGRKA